MPPSKYIRKLQAAIRLTHGCGSRHFTTVPVTEIIEKRVAWQGEVEVFDLIKHPKAQCCYAWSFEENGSTRTTSILGLPPVNSAEAAVKAALAAEEESLPK